MDNQSTDYKERTKIIVLDEPIVTKEKTYEMLELRVPTVGELRRAQTHFKGTADSGTMMSEQLIVAVTGMSFVAVEKLPMDVCLEASEWLMGFIPTPLKTSET